MTESNTVNPRLAAALAAADDGEVGAIVGIGLRALSAQSDGRYCECAVPTLTGKDLLCGACLLNNRDQEVRRVLDIVAPHDFVPRESRLRPDRKLPLCEVCTRGKDDPRHHGVPAIGRTSWGTEVRP